MDWSLGVLYTPPAHLSLFLQTVFLLWNSFNDPLFGWLSDRRFLSSQPRCVLGNGIHHCPNCPSPVLMIPE